MASVQHHDCIIGLLALVAHWQVMERSAGMLSGLREVCYRQLLETLSYKSECRGFDSFRTHYAPGPTQPLKYVSTTGISCAVKAAGA